MRESRPLWFAFWLAILIGVMFFVLLKVEPPPPPPPPLQPEVTIAPFLESPLVVSWRIIDTVCVDKEKIDFSFIEMSVSGGEPPYNLTIVNSDSNVLGPYSMQGDSSLRMKAYGGNSFTVEIRSSANQVWSGKITMPSESAICEVAKIPTSTEETIVPSFETLTPTREIVDILATKTNVYTATPTFTITPSLTSTSEVHTFAGMNNPNISSPEALGEIEYKYPLSMQPSNSEIVTVKIQVSGNLINIKPSQATQIAPISESENCPRIIGITRVMRVELDESPAFRILSSYPSQQRVSLSNPNEITLWQWVILPTTEGLHFLPLKVYWNEDSSPFWICNLRIFVGESTVTPSVTSSLTPTIMPTMTLTSTVTSTATLTPTLTPWYKPLGDNITNNSASVILWLLGTIAATFAGLGTIAAKHLRRKDAMNEKKEKLRLLKQRRDDSLLVDEIQKRKGETDLLEAELRKLETIKWWQFWR